jgi:hypothetical protein
MNFSKKLKRINNKNQEHIYIYLLLKKKKQATTANNIWIMTTTGSCGDTSWPSDI